MVKTKVTKFKNGSVTDIDKGLSKIIGEVKNLSGSYVKAGFPIEKEEIHKSKGSKGESSKESGRKENITLATLAAIHEFGAPSRKIDARPFMTQTFETSKNDVSKMKENLLSLIYQNKITTEKALEKLGVFYVGKIKMIFVQGQFKPNKKSTIARKKSSRPLIDTGHLRQGVTFEVKK